MDTTRGWVAAALAAAVMGCAAPSGPGGSGGAPDRRPCAGKCDASDDEAVYEYIVVGAGAGGGPLASSLARAGRSVLLLEAGELADATARQQIPALHPQASEDPALSWQYFVEHFTDPMRATRDSKYQYAEDGGPKGIFYPRGTGVGGSTGVNAMIAVYPHENDWSHVARLTGDPSWDASRMRDYFVEIERNGYLSQRNGRGHGFDGWLSIERPDSALALRDPKYFHFVKATAFVAGDGLLGDLGQLFRLMDRDLNAPGPERDAMEGAFVIPASTQDGRRVGVRDRVVSTMMESYPLAVQTRSLVTRVLFAEEPAEDGSPRAIGVEYLAGSHMYRADRRSSDAGEERTRRVYATREVILSAGAFNTPQLLMLSGVGPREELETHGIDVRVELPGVGRGLQDRYEVPVVTRSSQPYYVLRDCAFDPDAIDDCFQEWAEGAGPYTTNGGVISMVRRSASATTDDPDLFVFGLGGNFRGYYPGYSRDVTAEDDLFTWLVLKAHSNNEGTVRLRSADPRDPPRIHFEYFGDPAAGEPPSGAHLADLDAVVEGVRLVREIADRADRLGLFVSHEEVWPGRDVDTDEELSDFAMHESWGHHASCTARIGADDDPMAVLDGRFRVRGTTGLRVVDASVFPRIPGFFPVVAIFMMSEKAADTILADAAE